MQEFDDQVNIALGELWEVVKDKVSQENRPVLIPLVELVARAAYNSDTLARLDRAIWNLQRGTHKQGKIAMGGAAVANKYVWPHITACNPEVSLLAQEMVYLADEVLISSGLAVGSDTRVELSCMLSCLASLRDLSAELINSIIHDLA